MDWLDSLLEQRQLKQKAKVCEMANDDLAIQQAPAMLRKLAVRVEQEVTRYVTGGGRDGVRFSQIGQGVQGFEVKRDRYPTIFLQVALNRTTGTLQVVRSFQATASAETSHADSTIYIVATGPDEIYYRYKGKDYTDEGAVSGLLLQALLRFLEDPYSPSNYPLL